jgi:hypothetical protein
MGFRGGRVGGMGLLVVREIGSGVMSRRVMTALIVAKVHSRLLQMCTCEFIGSAFDRFLWCEVLCYSRLHRNTRCMILHVYLYR